MYNKLKKFYSHFFSIFSVFFLMISKYSIVLSNIYIYKEKQKKYIREAKFQKKKK